MNKPKLLDHRRLYARVRRLDALYLAADKLSWDAINAKGRNAKLIRVRAIAAWRKYRRLVKRAVKTV